MTPINAEGTDWAEHLSNALSLQGQPHSAFRAFDELCARAFGHRLFTILAWDGNADELQRVYSSCPLEYPVSARKPMGSTPWGDRILKEGRSWLGLGGADLRWAFPDHELIASLGCGTCLNAPVRWNGTVLGAVNILDAEGAYDHADLRKLEAITGFLVGPLLAANQSTV